MKKLVFVISSLIIASFSFAQTQQEMDKDAMESFKAKDKELNDVYQKILIKYKTDTAFISNLRIALFNRITERTSE